MLNSLANEYGVSQASITNWVNQLRIECQSNEEAKANYDFMKENNNLKK
jgi:orfA